MNTHTAISKCLQLLALNTSLTFTGHLLAAQSTQTVALSTATPPPPLSLHANRLQASPLAMLSSLTPDSTEGFLLRITQSTQEGQASLRSELSRVANDEAVVDAFSKRLLTYPVQNIARHLAILSSLGEMRNPRAVNPLREFIWSEVELVTSPTGATPAGGATYFNHEGALRARATEMLAWLNTNESSAETLHIAASHPRVEVRLAAIDSYLFNHGDSAKARADLAQVVRPSEIKLIGLPRFTTSSDRKTFDAQLAAFYVHHPEELPPAPPHTAHMNAGSTAMPRSSEGVRK